VRRRSRRGAGKEKFVEKRLFAAKSEELETRKEITFAFSPELAPGRTYVDVIVNGKQDNGRVRKIVEVKA